MHNPFLSTSEYDGSEYVSFRSSLNRAVLAKLPIAGIEDDIEGKCFSDIFSTPLIVSEIRRLSRHYRIDFSDIPDARLPMILNDALVSDDVRLRQLGERVIRKFGNRLGLLFLALRMGEEENRLARPDWDDVCWDYWRSVETLILTGGLASSMLGRRFKEQVHYIFDRVGEKPYRIRLYDNGAYLGVMGLAQRLMRGDETALVFDLGHTNTKRALVRRSGGEIAGFSAFESLPSKFMQSRFDNEHEEYIAALSLHNYIVKTIAATYREAREVTDVSERILISIANYTYSGRLNPFRGGYAKLSLLGDSYAAVLEETLSGELRRDVRVRLVHDATATALYFSDIPNAICLTLGTGFGVSFPEIAVN
jgi:hypothetical protein